MVLGEIQNRRTMPPLTFTAEEYRSAAQACRALAYQHEQDALKQSNPSVAATINASARYFSDLAQKYELAAKWL